MAEWLIVGLLFLIWWSMPKDRDYSLALSLIEQEARDTKALLMEVQGTLTMIEMSADIISGGGLRDGDPGDAP